MRPAWIRVIELLSLVAGATCLGLWQDSALFGAGVGLLGWFFMPDRTS